AGGSVLAPQSSKLGAAARRVRGSETFALGGTTVTVLDAPGHTPDSLALLVEGHLFTGDALFAGGAGRTDFMGGSPSDLFDTMRRFEALPDATVVHPGHDYVGRPVTTIGEEKAENPLLRERDRGRLVGRLGGRGGPPGKSGQDPPPQPGRGGRAGGGAGGPPRRARGSGAADPARCPDAP